MLLVEPAAMISDAIACAHVTIAANQELFLLHRRFGHLGIANLWRLAATNGINLPADADLPFCEGCALGKARCKPFPRSTTSYTPFQRVDADISGPFLLLLTGNKHTLHFIDRALRHTVSCFLPSKESPMALQDFKDYRQYIQTQYRASIL